MGNKIAHTTPAGTEIQRTQEQGRTSQEPSQDTGITDNRFTEALKKIGVNNITGSLADYANIAEEQQTARRAAEARRNLRRVLRETRADPRESAGRLLRYVEVLTVEYHSDAVTNMKILAVGHGVSERIKKAGARCTRTGITPKRFPSTLPLLSL